MMGSKHDREVLRELAANVAQIAALPEQQIKRERWMAHNALEKGKPMIMCFPGDSWRELLPESRLVLSESPLRDWERSLRQTIYAHEHIDDDEVVEPVFDIGWVQTFSGWGLKERWICTEVPLGSGTWEPPIKELSDIEKLEFPKTLVDEERTHELVALAHDLFGDLLEVRIRGMIFWSVGLANTAAMLRGLEPLMLDMCEHPEWVHELMSFLRDGTLHWIKSLEAEGVLSLNNEADHVCSGGVFHSRELPAPGYLPGHVRLRDTWGFAESQEFVGISPRFFEEFALAYQLPLLEQFGLTAYGCCEPLHDRLEQIKRIPNLRRVSISPWADPEISAEALGDRYIFSYKPHPGVLVAEQLDELSIKRQLERVVKTAGDGVLEIIMKDTQTLRNEPWRIERWTEIAREVVGEMNA
ncbi:MAG: hypothetical protein V1800_08015 [Candidatus Latescibacterota bacterium]